MTNAKFHRLFGDPPRKPESELTQREMDIARSIQVVTEEVVLRLAKTVQKEQGTHYLCMAGGVALNCVANGRILREGPFRDIWIQPAAGDAGGALGAALAAWYEYKDMPRKPNGSDAMQGTKYADESIKTYLDSIDAKYEHLEDDSLMQQLVGILEDGKVVGLFQGRMELWPWALGGRSIIGDPRNREMQSVMNLKIKYRESFRPFAPAVLADRANDYFEIDKEQKSPYMLIVAPVKPAHRIPMTEEQQNLFGIEKLNVPSSNLPAITHVDYSARLQTIHNETNPRFHKLLTEFDRRTGCPVLVNTSFNVRSEPIVESPEDAYRCFVRMEMDYLVLENYLLKKKISQNGKRMIPG